MRRGQAEIIGLVVVVLLLVFALIFFVKFKSSDDDNESRLIRSNLRTNSALNALMKVNVDGGKKQMKDLIEECVDSGYGSRECDLASKKLSDYLSNEIGFSIEGYHLIVSVKGGNDVISLVNLGKDCKNSISASPFILKNNGKVELKICT